MAHIYAEIVGYGATSDGADMVAPSGEGGFAVCKWRCKVLIKLITSIHTVPQRQWVTRELEAIQEVFGNNSPAISATKAMSGHSLGAAGVHEAIYSLLMLEHGFIAPSINVENLDESCGLEYRDKPTEQALDTVMSNSFGFGGTNATLVMSKYKA